jgi:chorismate mutase
MKKASFGRSFFCPQNPVGAGLPAKNSRTPHFFNIYGLSLTTIASKLAPTEEGSALKLKLGFILLAISANVLAAPPTLAPLLDSIAERLAIADQVALSKWDSHKPVEDRAREQDVIASVVAQAPSYKLAPAQAEQFFSAQIESNKLVQYAHLSDWQLKGKAPNDPRPDLVGQIRPELDLLQKRLLQQLADFTPERTNPQCPQWLAQANHAPAHDALHQLAMIRATAELCLL